MQNGKSLQETSAALPCLLLGGTLFNLEIKQSIFNRRAVCDCVWYVFRFRVFSILNPHEGTVWSGKVELDVGCSANLSQFG
jgi:hypothetical protein